MASIKPIHSGPMLPLAIMALFAIMIPVISIANSNQKVEQTNAMMMRVPGNTPTPVKLQPTGTQKPTPTSRPMMRNSY